jgi:homogentisate 1,2-dioxygenase
MKLLRELLEELEAEELLNEAPQRIAALRLEPLENPRKNKKLYKSITQLTPNAKVIETTSTGIKLYQVVKSKEHEIYAVDEEEGRIVYYVRYEVQAAEFVDEDWATQVLVWKGTLSAPKTEGLPKHIFFTYVLPLTGTSVSDGEQTTDGERFWKYRIADAFAVKKYKVYLVDFNQKKVVKFKTRDEYEALLGTKNDPWGDTAWHKGIRLAISDHDFTQE